MKNRRDETIDIMVGISICNEKYSEFEKTMLSLLKNIHYLFQRFEGIEPKNIVIVVIHDGIEKLAVDFVDDANGKILKKDNY